MKAKIVLLPGDGAGPEVVAEGRCVLEAVADAFGHAFCFEAHAIGGAGIDTVGDPLPPETLEACQQADAVLLGAVGGPKWSDPTAPVRPEQGLLGLRKGLGLFANLRPVRVYPELIDASPLRADRLEDVDLIIVRELTGGIYFGERQEAAPAADGALATAYDTMSYNEAEVRRIAHVAFRLAQERRGRVMSVDKANVLASSRLWRRTVDEVAAQYPDIPCESMLVDAAAMHLLRRPSDFDVVLTSNMFGDILADEASMLAGSMGLLPSASLGAPSSAEGVAPGLYEPIHGSAPDIAGQGIVNPLATILSAAMLLRHSLGLTEEAEVVEDAVERALQDGLRTADLANRPIDAGANRVDWTIPVGDGIGSSDSAGGSPCDADLIVVGTEQMGANRVDRMIPVGDGIGLSDSVGGSPCDADLIVVGTEHMGRAIAERVRAIVADRRSLPGKEALPAQGAGSV